MSRAAATFAALTLGAVILCAGCAKPPKPGEPLVGLTPEERALFDRGKARFTTVFTPGTGLGPPSATRIRPSEAAATRSRCT